MTFDRVMDDQSAPLDGTMAAGTSARQRDRIARYYREAEFDYNAVWRTNRNLAMHFGFDGGPVRGHDNSIVLANRRLADLAMVDNDTRVVDFGCGRGGTSIWLAKERNCLATGVDLLEHQIVQARQQAARANVDNRVHFIARDFTASGLEAKSFDVALAQESLCHAERKEHFYREAHRVLVPGGRLLIAEYMRMGRDRSAAEEGTIRDWCDGWAMPDLLTGPEHMAAARSAGFRRVDVTDATADVWSSLARLHRYATACYPVHWVLRNLRLRTQTQHGNIVAALLQFEALKRGSWFYGLLLATK
jgi:tocopherol O-methyltransferase